MNDNYDDGICATDFQLCLQPQDCWDANLESENSRTADCWWLTISLLVSGGAMILFAEIYGDPEETLLICWFRFWEEFVMVDSSKKTNFIFSERSARSTSSRSSQNGNDDNDVDYDDDDEYSMSDLGGPELETTSPSSPFYETIRTEENFLRNHQDRDLQLPCSYGPEYIPTSIRNSILPLRGFFQPASSGNKNAQGKAAKAALLRSRAAISVFMGSLGTACLCSATSTVLWLGLNYEDTCVMGDQEGDGPLHVLVQETARTFVAVIQGYVFLPVMLLAGYVGFIAFRWRDWMVNCHALQGNMHDIGVLCGGSFTSMTPPSVEQRKLLFRIYRHLNAIHALCYKTVSASLAHLLLEDFCDDLGLLTEDELEELYPYPSKIRDGVITMLTLDIAMLCQADNVAIPHGQMIHIIRDIRSRAARHHDLFIRDNPNLYLKLLLLVVNTLLFFTLLSYPFTLLLRTPPSFSFLPCFQPATLFGVFLVVSSYRSAFSMVTRLRNPFSWTKDRINVDMLLASTDMCLFTVLRSRFTTTKATLCEEPQHEQQEQHLSSQKQPGSRQSQKKQLRFSRLAGSSFANGKAKRQSRKQKLRFSRFADVNFLDEDPSMGELEYIQESNGNNKNTSRISALSTTSLDEKETQQESNQEEETNDDQGDRHKQRDSTISKGAIRRRATRLPSRGGRQSTFGGFLRQSSATERRLTTIDRARKSTASEFLLTPEDCREY